MFAELYIHVWYSSENFPTVFSIKIITSLLNPEITYDIKGGIKAVVWADTIQAFFMFGGQIAILLTVKANLSNYKILLDFH